MTLLESFWEREDRSLFVFDFDDTLVKTGSMVFVENFENPHPELGPHFALTPGEYAVYEERPGDAFDFSDFEKLVDPQEIEWSMRVMRNAMKKHGADSVVVLTARGASSPVRAFLDSQGLSEVQVKALGGSHPELKARWIEAVIRTLRLTRVEFFDDSHKNVRAVQELDQRMPGTKIRTHHVRH